MRSIAHGTKEAPRRRARETCTEKRNIFITSGDAKTACYAGWVAVVFPRPKLAGFLEKKRLKATTNRN